MRILNIGAAGGGGGSGDALTTDPLSQFAATSSAQFASVISDEIGTGKVILQTSPTLITPVLGVATITSLNKVTITAPATGSTLTLVDGKTLTASNTLTLTGTDGITAAFGGGLAIAAAKVFTVSNTLTFTGTDSSSVAFGAGGTAAYTGGTLAQFAATTSAELAGVISNETGTGALVFASTPTLVTPEIGVATGTGLVLTSVSATALAVGPAGTTNPSFVVDASTASAASGLKITSAASGSGVTVETIGGTNETLTIKPKGSSGNLNLGAAVASSINLNAVTAGSINLQLNTGTKLAILQKNSTWTHSARTSGTTTFLAITGATDTALTAATEALDVFFDLSQTKQHASNTTVALQRSFVISPPTLTFASNGGVYTEASALSVLGPPNCDANNTITSSYGIHVPTRALTGVTNGYGLFVVAPSGAATLNLAALFTGAVKATGIFTPVSATSVTAGGVVAMTLGVSAPSITVGSGAPSVSAAQGSIYLRSDGTTVNNRLYVNTDGATTWTAVTTAG